MRDARRNHRLGVALGMRVRGTNQNGVPFAETVSSHDVSRGGCSFRTARPLAAGTELEVEIERRAVGPRIPAPFVTQAVVSRIARSEDGGYVVGIKFTGAQFPIFASETAE